MMLKIKLLVVLMVLSSFIQLLSIQPISVEADHTAAHCAQQWPDSGYAQRLCIEGAPRTFGDWEQYCRNKSPQDGAVRSCLTEFYGSENPIGHGEGVWCATNTGRVIFHYQRTTGCPSTQSTTKDIPRSFAGNVWCQLTATVIQYYVGIRDCPSGFGTEIENPLGGDPNDPNDPNNPTGPDFCEENPESCVAEPFTAEPGDPFESFQAETIVDCDEDPNTADSINIMCQFIRFVNFLSIGVTVVAAISVGVAGFQYMSSRGDPSKTAAAVRRVVQVGLAIVMYTLGWAMLNWIIPGGVLN